MRKIKFRAWDTYKKEMVSCDEWQIAGLQHYLSGNSGYKVMQYTGLEDCNGQQMYEHDIVKSHKQNFIGVIDWDKTGYACFRVYEIKGNNKEDSIWSCVDHLLEYEVIGNIYKHPELLE